jgi:hypothetical protein
MRGRSALAVFAWSRAAIWLGAVALYFLLRPDAPRPHGPTPGGSRYPLDMWANWDGAWFTQIAEHSYASAVQAPAFYPLYPGAMAVLGRMLGGEYVVAGLLISIAAAALAFVLFERLGELEVGRPAAQRAVVILAVFPLTLFFQAVYSEAIYLLLAVSAFLLARRGRWPYAAGVTAAAFLARPSAVAIWAGLLVLAWQQRNRRAIAWLAPAPLAVGIYALVLRWQVGDAFAFAHAEKYWSRELSYGGPFGGAWEGLVAAVEGVHRLLVGGSTPADWNYPAGLSPAGQAAVNVEGFAWLVVYVVLAVLVWRRLGAAYGTFAALSIALPLSLPWHRFPLFSMPRFGLTVFPFFFVLGQLTSTPRRYVGLTLVLTALLVLNVARWSLWYWVS